MKKYNKGTILARMRKNVQDCRDNRTGEVNHTLLAETTCADLQAWNHDDVPEEFFELATEFR